MRSTTPHPSVKGFVLAKYRLEGWEVVCPPAVAPMDLICVRDSKFHFVKLIVDKEPTDGEKNNFIQNALSNCAIPIYATVDGEKLSLKDINEAKKVVIARRGAPA